MYEVAVLTSHGSSNIVITAVLSVPASVVTMVVMDVRVNVEVNDFGPWVVVDAVAIVGASPVRGLSDVSVVTAFSPVEVVPDASVAAVACSSVEVVLEASVVAVSVVPEVQ